MQAITLDSNMLYFFMAIVLAIMGIQTNLLLKLRNVVQQTAKHSRNADLPSWEIGASDTKAAPAFKMAKTCQNCKHRLTYINSSRVMDAEDDFSYKCGLQNKSVLLKGSCLFFEQEEQEN